MANEEKTKEDHPFSLPASDPVNTTVFDSPAVKHKLPLYLQNMFLACGYNTISIWEQHKPYLRNNFQTLVGLEIHYFSIQILWNP